MKKITDKARKILRRVFMFAGAGAVSLLFQACYGPVEPDFNIDISGTVRCNDTGNPIPGINVTVKNDQSYFMDDRTTLNGEFRIGIPRWETGKYILEFEDVDEEYNGGWFETKTEEIEILEDDMFYKKIDIYLEKKDSNNEGE